MKAKKEKEISFVESQILSRAEFVAEVRKYSVKDFLELRTEIDSFLIAYDQLFDKYNDFLKEGK